MVDEPDDGWWKAPAMLVALVVLTVLLIIFCG
jgi:hypothetical protein